MGSARTGLAWLGSSGPASVFVAAVLMLGVLALVIVYGLSPTPSHDEDQYIAAASLVGDRSIYRDFFHSQTPYFALSLAGWLALFPEASVYGAARVFNVLWSLLFFVASWGLVWRVTRAPLLATVLIAGLATSPLLAPAISLVRNDMMPLFFAILAVACMIHVSPAKRRASATLSFLAGLCAAIAFGAKQSYAFLPAALVIFALLGPTYAGWRDRLLDLLVPLCVGGFLGGAPLAAIAGESLSGFLYDTFEYHRTADPIWFTRVGQFAQTRLSSRLIIFSKLALDFFTVSLLLSFLVCVGLIAKDGLGRRLAVDRTAGNAILLSVIGLVLATATLLGFATSIFAQYLAPLVTLAAIVCAAAVGAAGSVVAGSRIERRPAVAGGAVLLVGFGAFANVLSDPGNSIARLGCIWQDCVWAPSHVRRVAMRLNQILGPGSDEVKIATLMSAYPLEARFGIYDELAGAPFFYRVNDALPRERVRSLRGVAPDEVADWLAEIGARAVLTGYQPGYDADLEAGFVRFARQNGLIPLKVDLEGGYKQDRGSGIGLLWVAPSLLGSTATPDRGAAPDAVTDRAREP